MADNESVSTDSAEARDGVSGASLTRERALDGIRNLLKREEQWNLLTILNDYVRASEARVRSLEESEDISQKRIAALEQHAEEAEGALKTAADDLRRIYMDGPTPGRDVESVEDDIRAVLSARPTASGGGVDESTLEETNETL